MKRLRAWLQRITAVPQPAKSLPHHSSSLIWDEEAFYGMAEQLFGDQK